mgnify:CR=1 FL=1
MGELSQRIGKKLEHYGNSIFEHLEWKILAQDVQIDCIRAAHKNAKSSDKKTHGVDILAGYYNPFTKRQEAFIILANGLTLFRVICHYGLRNCVILLSVLQHRLP